MAGKLYISALNRFTAEHQIPRDIASRIRKLGEEHGELSEAIINRDLAAMQEEAADLVNVAFDLLSILTKDPWAALMENLAEKDRKYKEGKQRLEAKK